MIRRMKLWYHDWKFGVATWVIDHCWSFTGKEVSDIQDAAYEAGYNDGCMAIPTAADRADLDTLAEAGIAAGKDVER